MAKRPAVVRLFHKNGHNYRKDYGVDVHTLGLQVREWWAEICPPNEVPAVRFGGPTGIYTIVVLLSWWRSLLPPKPDGEHADCLHTLEDVDRVFVATINNIKTRRTVTPSATSSSTAPPPPSQLRKRANSGETSPQKRTRSG